MHGKFTESKKSLQGTGLIVMISIEKEATLKGKKKQGRIRITGNTCRVQDKISQHNL